MLYDNITNANNVQVMDTTTITSNNKMDLTKGYEEFKDSQWKEIKSGDIILVKNNSIVPCDIIILTKSYKDVGIMIETSSLDGETSLKSKLASNCM